MTLNRFHADRPAASRSGLRRKDYGARAVQPLSVAAADVLHAYAVTCGAFATLMAFAPHLHVF
jgi:hypothetical protein